MGQTEKEESAAGRGDKYARIKAHTESGGIVCVLWWWSHTLSLAASVRRASGLHRSGTATAAADAYIGSPAQRRTKQNCPGTHRLTNGTVHTAARAERAEEYAVAIVRGAVRLHDGKIKKKRKKKENTGKYFSFSEQTPGWGTRRAPSRAIRYTEDETRGERDGESEARTRPWVGIVRSAAAGESRRPDAFIH